MPAGLRMCWAARQCCILCHCFNERYHLNLKYELSRCSNRKSVNLPRKKSIV
jgi:hypothetical protein